MDSGATSGHDGSRATPTTGARAAVTSTTTPASSATAVVPPVTRPSAATSVPAASSVPVQPPTTTVPISISVQLFWTRPPAEDRRIDLPGFVDASSGPRPLVLYGGATNNGAAAISRPSVRVVWDDAAGHPVAAVTAVLIEPGTTTPVETLAPGGSADVIVVVTDANVAAKVAGLVPRFTGAAG